MICVTLVVALTNLATTADDGWRPLLDGGLSAWNVSLDDAPDGGALDLENAFSVSTESGEPVLRVDGRQWGSLVSLEQFESYHLRAEFRWGEGHYGELPYREAGLLYHSTGLPRAATRGIPARLGTPGRPGPLADPPGSGAFLESLEYHVVAALDSEVNPEIDRAVGDFGWFGRNCGDIAERVPEEQMPRGVWNRLEIRCHGNESVHLLNGTVVAIMRGLRRLSDRGGEPLFGGRLQIQSAGDEIEWRRVEVRSIDGLFEPAAKDWAQKFERARRKAIQAENVDRAVEALLRYRDIEAIPPLEEVIEAYEFTAYARQARTLARLGLPDDAFEMLTLAIQYGWTDAEEIRDAGEFIPYREDDRHQQAIRMAHSLASDRTPMHVSSALGAPPVPLILAIHSRLGSAHGFLQSWTRAADTAGAGLVALKSPYKESLRIGRGIWDREDGGAGEGLNGVDVTMALDLAHRAIERYDSEVAPVDRSRVVLVGYGQGGAVALRLLAAAPGEFAGVFAYGTRFESIGVDAWRGALAERPFKVALSMGALDERRSTLELAREELEAASVPLRTTLLPGVGHERPLDHRVIWVDGLKTEQPTEHVGRQVEAIRWLLGER